MCTGISKDQSDLLYQPAEYKHEDASYQSKGNYVDKIQGDQYYASTTTTVTPTK